MNAVFWMDAGNLIDLIRKQRGIFKEDEKITFTQNQKNTVGIS